MNSVRPLHSAISVHAQSELRCAHAPASGAEKRAEALPQNWLLVSTDVNAPSFSATLPAAVCATSTAISAVPATTIAYWIGTDPLLSCIDRPAIVARESCRALAQFAGALPGRLVLRLHGFQPARIFERDGAALVGICEDDARSILAPSDDAGAIKRLVARDRIEHIVKHCRAGELDACHAPRRSRISLSLLTHCYSPEVVTEWTAGVRILSVPIRINLNRVGFSRLQTGRPGLSAGES